MLIIIGRIKYNMDEEKRGWSSDAIYEILRDCLCFELILEVKRRMNYIEAKNYLSMFLKSLAPVLVYEVADSLEKIDIMMKKDFFNSGMNKKVQQERQKFLKRDILKSSLPGETQKEMGLNFNELVYDMNVILKDDELLDMNYEIFMEDITGDFEFWDSLFGIPNAVVNAIISGLGFDFKLENVFTSNKENFVKLSEIAESELAGQRYSYSVYKLFSRGKNLELQDKVFILYRYRLLSSIHHLERVIPQLTIMRDNVVIVDGKAFFRKYKATVIEIVGKELLLLNSAFGQDIAKQIEEKIIDKRFFSLNRKLRNNIHYSNIEVLEAEEINLVDMYQNAYIDLLVQYIKDKLYIDIDDECKTMTSFLNECMKKGIRRGEIEKNYEKLYLRYYYTGSLE